MCPFAPTTKTYSHARSPDEGPRQTTPRVATAVAVTGDDDGRTPRSPPPVETTVNSRVFVVNNNNGIPNNVYTVHVIIIISYYHHHDVRTLKYSEISLNQGRG